MIFVFLFDFLGSIFRFRESDKDEDNKFKGGDKWLHNFTKRNGISKQRKTNNKSQSITERLVKNFHWYTIYQMATEEL